MAQTRTTRDVQRLPTETSGEQDDGMEDIQCLQTDQNRFRDVGLCNIIDGRLYPPFINVPLLQKIKEIRPRAEDIWCISYPKSGMHWLHEALYMLREQRDTHHPDDMTKYFLDYDRKTPDFDVIDALQRTSGPRVSITHLHPELLNEGLASSGARLIYLHRNPKDVVVSAFYHIRNLYPETGLTCSQFIEHVLDGYEWYGGHLAHMRQWNKFLHMYPAHKLHFLSFDEMKLDPAAVLRGLASFLQLPLSEELCSSVIAALSIERVRQARLELGGTFSHKHNKLYRKGISGDWKNHFTASQNERMDALVQRQLKDIILPDHFLQ